MIKISNTLKILLSISIAITFVSVVYKKNVDKQYTFIESVVTKNVGKEKVTNQQVTSQTVDKQYVEKQFVRTGYLDKIFDFEKVPNTNGYVLWSIGLKDGELAGVQQASGSTVTIMGGDFFGMNYKSQEEYYNDKGPEKFRNIINNKK